jgi:hypothetical protein
MNKVEKLRSLIRENIETYIKEIDNAANEAAMEARINKCEEAIQMRESKLSSISESDHKDLIDENKIKTIEKEIGVLKKAKAKFEKQKEKMLNKGKKKEEVKDETITEDTPIDESDITAEMNMDDEPIEEGSEKQTFNVKNLKGYEKHKPFKKLRKGDSDPYHKASSNVSKDEKNDPYNTPKSKHQPMDETMINEAFLKMQKIAGVITEAQYNSKKSLIENQLNEFDMDQFSLGSAPKASFEDKWNVVPNANKEVLKKSTGKEPILIMASSKGSNYLVAKGSDDKFYLYTFTQAANPGEPKGPFNSEEDAKKGVK